MKKIIIFVMIAFALTACEKAIIDEEQPWRTGIAACPQGCSFREISASSLLDSLC